MIEKIKCENCQGDGWTLDHSLQHYEHPEKDCGSCGCPVQVPCEDCKGEGFITIEVKDEN